MAKYICTVCGEVYDEEKEGIPSNELPENWVCPLCNMPKEKYRPADGCAPSSDLKLNPDLIRENDAVLSEIRETSYTGKNLTEAMETLLPVPDFSEILLLGSQLASKPLEESDIVSLRTVIVKKAKQPVIIEMPICISHMSFGALSANAKIALAKGSASAKTAMCSGEGGVLNDEMVNSHRYIFEYVPNRYSVNDSTFGGCDAVEIKIGQGTKPGMGGHLPGKK